jgi:hypothetical protein
VRTIIAGSRTVKDLAEVMAAIESCPWEVSTVLCGCAKGPDTLALVWAGEETAVEFYPANWEKHGKSAGCIRNREMVEKAEALIAIWDGSSHGTADVITCARKAGLPVHIHQVGSALAPKPKPQQEFAL